MKSADFAGERRADADAGAKLLVGAFEPRRDIDGVAIGGVVEKMAAAEGADDRRPGMRADPRQRRAQVLSPGSVRRIACA